MEPPPAEAQGERVLGVMLTHLVAMPPTAMKGLPAPSIVADAARAVLPQLPATVCAPLHDVAGRAGAASIVARLACASRAANAAAASLLPKPKRTARYSKAVALLGVATTALFNGVLSVPDAQAALLALCAPDAPPPPAARAPDADEAARWIAFAWATRDSLTGEPSPFEAARLAADALLNAPLRGPAEDDAALLRKWRARRFLAALAAPREQEHE
jgi:hypothetical protein